MVNPLTSFAMPPNARTFVLKPDCNGQVQRREVVDINLGHTPESLVRAAYAQPNGQAAPDTLIKRWARELLGAHERGTQRQVGAVFMFLSVGAARASAARLERRLALDARDLERPGSGQRYQSQLRLLGERRLAVPQHFTRKVRVSQSLGPSKTPRKNINVIP
jgi:hypothetical protein